jgi:hypothetical protein
MHHPVQHLFVSTQCTGLFSSLSLSAAAERARRSPRRAVPLRNNEREHLLLNAHFLMRNVRF